MRRSTSFTWRSLSCQKDYALKGKVSFFIYFSSVCFYSINIIILLDKSHLRKERTSYLKFLFLLSPFFVLGQNSWSSELNFTKLLCYGRYRTTTTNNSISYFFGLLCRYCEQLNKPVPLLSYVRNFILILFTRIGNPEQDLSATEFQNFPNFVSELALISY